MAAADPSVGYSSADDEEYQARSDSSKKRKRTELTSCELCKSRKVKCDRVQPTCGGCARNDRVCEYKERQKPGFRAGYGRELEAKINRLEAMLHSLGRRVEDHIEAHPASHLGPDVLRQTHASPDLTKHSDASPSALNGVQSHYTPTSNASWTQPPNSDRLHYSRPTDAMAVHSVCNTAPTQVRQSETAAISVPLSATERTLALSETEGTLPPYDLLYDLVDLYFKHVNPWSPILDRQATFDAIFGPTHPSGADYVLLHAIIVTTLRFSKDARLNPEKRRFYRDLSQQKVQLYGLEYTNVRALQALLIISLDELGTSNGQKGWNLLALLARSVVQLGLNVEKSIGLVAGIPKSVATPQALSLGEPESWIQDEERRRLCWMVYVLDRYATVATTADFVLDERDIRRQLPCRYDLFSQNQPLETCWAREARRFEAVPNRSENLGSFSYHCDVLTILGAIHKFLKRPVDITSPPDVNQWQAQYRQLDTELDGWLYNLPGDYIKISQLCHSDPSSKISNWIMLHAAFHTSVIRLHSTAAYPIVHSHLFTPSYNAMQRCLTAVENLREIAQDAVNTGMLDLLGAPFAFSLWVSARLLLVHAATTDRDVDPRVGFFVATLQQMGQYWEIAHKHAKSLTSVLEEYQRNRRAAAIGDGAETAMPKNLGAMRG